MKSFLGLAILVAAFFVVAQSTIYPSSIAYYEGTALRFWDFGATTFTSAVVAQSYAVNVLVNGTLTPANIDGSTGEYQPMLCNGVTCPVVCNTSSSSLFYAGVAELTQPLAYANTSYTSVARLQATDTIFITGNLNYRRVVPSASDSLDVGGNSTQGYAGGSSFYYFDFGAETVIAPPVVYVVGNSTSYVTLFSSQATHFVTKTTITPPADTTIKFLSFTRSSDIPAAWITNSSLTTNGTTVYEFGFNRVSATPAPSAAAVTLPSLAALLFAALLAMLL